MKQDPKNVPEQSARQVIELENMKQDELELLLAALDAAIAELDNEEESQ